MLRSLVIATLILGASTRAHAAAGSTALYPDLPPAKNYLQVAQIAVETVGKKWQLTEQKPRRCNSSFVAILFANSRR